MTEPPLPVGVYRYATKSRIIGGVIYSVYAIGGIAVLIGLGGSPLFVLLRFGIPLGLIVSVLWLDALNTKLVVTDVFIADFNLLGRPKSMRVDDVKTVELVHRKGREFEIRLGDGVHTIEITSNIAHFSDLREYVEARAQPKTATQGVGGA